MNATLSDIQEALELLEQKRKFESQLPSPPTEWDLFWASKHIVFFKLISFILALIFVSGFLPILLVSFWPNINASLADTLQNVSQGSVKFFCGFLAVSFAEYLLENVFYQYINRNGDNYFDYQENFKELNSWQKIKIATIKKLGYLFYFSWCLL